MPDGGTKISLTEQAGIEQAMKLAARAASLRYVNDGQPGIRRVRTRSGFEYRMPDGSKVTDEETLARIRKLAIPPAYESVWICVHANGHLQAVGRDARGRKQYRYHPRWRETRDEAKFGKMLLFGKILPQIRRRVAEDLARPGLPREKVLATIVRLLETALARVGNEEYARTNRSFGLTTLRNRHVKVTGGHISFDFRGKSGMEHHIDLHDKRLARIVRRCQDLPGQELFQYIGEDGAPHTVDSDDVNAYLREISGEDITAKDFRTWAGTHLAALALRELGAWDTQKRAKSNIVQAVQAVSRMLGNTPAVCRKCYIHPAVLEGYIDGTILKLRWRQTTIVAEFGLKAEETAVLGFLRRLETAKGKQSDVAATLIRSAKAAGRAANASRSRRPVAA